MAERTKFLSYCVYSAIISALIYPIEAHWIWGGGWLAQMGFHDFAGSCAIHMVGGIAALVGAIMVGPRIGKFERDKSGKVIKVNAFPATTSLSEHWVYSSCGSAGTDSTVQLVHQLISWHRYL